MGTQPSKDEVLFCLGHKGLPYDVIWVEFPDITATMKSIGASPTREGYTVPVIKDPNTGAVVSDSHAIAKYLDETYPDKPLIPRGAHVLVQTFESQFRTVVLKPSLRLLMARSLEMIQNDTSREFFITRRLRILRETSWRDVAPEGKAQEQWAALKKGLGVVDGWYQMSGGRWLMGNIFSFADIVVVCFLVWWNVILKEGERQEIYALHGGRWRRLLTDVNAECNTDLGSFGKHGSLRSFL